MSEKDTQICILENKGQTDGFLKEERHLNPNMFSICSFYPPNSICKVTPS